jgi:uncharacterized protein involved in exopolysaccharide biosynthesis
MKGSGNDVQAIGVNVTSMLPTEGWVSTLWHRRRFVGIGTVLAGLAATAYTLLTPSIYTAQLTLLPRPDEMPSNAIFNQLASITGFSADSGGTQEALFDKIIVSDTVLDSVIVKTWSNEVEGGEGTLCEVLGWASNNSDAQSSIIAHQKTKVYLRREALSFFRDGTTGFMRLRVSLPERPMLAAGLANELVARLDAFLRRSAQTRASDQRRFIEERLKDILGELRDSEEQLVVFETTNRAWAESPELSRKRGELTRDVQTQTALWIELKRQLELAKLDEVKDTVRVEVLDAASIPAEKSGPNRLLIVLAGFALGFVLTSSWVLARRFGATAVRP